MTFLMKVLVANLIIIFINKCSDILKLNYVKHFYVFLDLITQNNNFRNNSFYFLIFAYILALKMSVSEYLSIQMFTYDF